MVERNARYYRYFERERRRSRRLRIISYIFLGLLAAATPVIYYAVTR